MKTSHIGRINTDRYLIKTECQDDQLDKIGDKDFVRPTIIKQVKNSYDSRQRIENPTLQKYPQVISRYRLINKQGM